MGVRDFTRAVDEELLQTLDLYHGEGLSAGKVAEALSVSKNTVVGKINRVGKDKTPCLCKKPENKDLGMPRGWWR